MTFNSRICDDDGDDDDYRKKERKRITLNVFHNLSRYMVGFFFFLVKKNLSRTNICPVYNAFTHTLFNPTCMNNMMSMNMTLSATGDWLLIDLWKVAVRSIQ